MSNLEITKLVNTIDQMVRNTEGADTNKHMTISGFIGGVIGSQLPLPSSPVKNSRIHYQDQVYPLAADYIGQINEAHYIDVELALETSYLIWLDRYKLVHSTRVDAVAMMYRLHVVATTCETRLDAQRIDSITRVLGEQEVTQMNTIMLDLMKQLQTDGE